MQPYCYHCGSPLADTETEYCQNCRKHRSFVAEGRSLFVYRGAVQKSMYRFKYANRRRYARFLAEEAMQRWENWMREKRIEAIVPVPMYSKKERYRGYNQAALFGRALSEKMDIPCIPRLMIRVKDTRPQKELNGRERENNVKNAFQRDVSERVINLCQTGFYPFCTKSYSHSFFHLLIFAQALELLFVNFEY